VNRESVVDVEGVVAKAKVASCTQSDAEIQIARFYTVSMRCALRPRVPASARPGC
jgi:hypothetical protein